MAIVRAVKTGVWSDPTVWNTGALPTSADDVYSNTFTVTIDVSPTVLSVQNGSTTGVTAGGGFVISANGITLTCTGGGIIAGTSVTCLSISLVVGQSCLVVSNVFNSYAISFSGLGTFNLVGNISGTTSTQGTYVTIGGNGTFNQTGNIIGGTAVNSSAVACNNNSPTMNITGSVTGGTASNNVGILLFGLGNTGILNVTGSCTSSIGVAINTNSNAGSTHFVSITGALVPANDVPAYVNITSASVTAILSGPFLVSSNGTSGLRAISKWFWANSNVTPTYYQVRTANLATIRPLYTADSVGGNPAVGNVRSGTVFGPNNELTGTCAVPPAGSVALGVPVDATTGTAVLTQANFQAALTAQGLTTTRAANLDNLDTTVSSRLATSGYTAPLSASGTRTALGLAAANLDSQLTPLTNLDTTVSSRLATTSYLAPLTAAGTRSALGLASANLDTQLTPLTNLDTSVSSRLATTSYSAPLDASGTRSAIGLATANLDSQLAPLPNLDTTVSSRLATSGYTTPPTSTQNATAVRTELSPELARIDTTVSSRLASSSYTTPPTAGDIATAVWNAATSALTALGSVGKLIVDNVNATISSRLAAASYSAPLDASGTRAAIGLASANLDTQLTPLPNLDTTVSSRLAAASYSAPLDASGTRAAIGLASANLDTQLTPLSNLDTTVSSRLASASYQNPLDAAGTRAAIGMATANLDTQLDALPTATENATAVRSELAPELGNLDVAVSTRSTFDPTTDVVAHVTLVDTTTDLTNPPVVPTTTEIADAVRIELTPELDRIDTEVSTRSTFDPATDTVAQVTLVDTTTNLTNPPDVPTTTEIADAVRIELTPELSHLDADVTTRLAAADYVEPPTAEQNAEAVRAELTPELERVSNCATVDTTGQQISNALTTG